MVRRTGLAAARKAAGHTQESLAAALHIDRSTVIRWEAGDYAPLPYIRPKLARLLNQTPEQLATLIDVPTAEPFESLSPDVEAACTWLDERLGWKPGTSAQRVAERLPETRRDLPARRARRARVTRSQIANALKTYYGDDPTYSTYTARVGSAELETSILTRPEWLDLDIPLTSENEHITLTHGADDAPVAIEPEAALERLAEVEAAGVRLKNNPIYRLLNVAISSDDIHTTLGITEFLNYALSLDLLENELHDAIAEERPTKPGSLPLRDMYLPTIHAVTNLPSHLCVGGVVALCAIVRRVNGITDQVLLFQERSTSVVNAPGQLTVIPKGFHQPLTDYALDAPLRASLVREIEEELFSRVDLDSAEGRTRRLSPLHSSQMSEAMQWLTEDHRMRLRATAFGLNLMSGNFEFTCLIAVDDPAFWSRFAGCVEANWEVDTLRTYQQQDFSIGTTPSRWELWNHEGLFALSSGLHRAATGRDRQVPTTQ